MDFKKFGEAVRQRRSEEGLSQDDLATQVGVSRTYISLIERGQATNLSWGVVSSLSKALGITTTPEADIDSSKELTDDERQRMPKGLKAFAKSANLPPEDQRMLLSISYRGKQPTDEAEWRVLYNVIKTIVKKEGGA